ncbi:MAG: glycosyltransferase family 2 protein [Candidatus Taylorbacteria bacterium]
MKVSIVIPAYNEEKTLAQTIEAALAQDYHNYEVIVIDNASKDRTSEVASHYNVKIFHEPKKGLLHARERGRNEASGQIIANMDADCIPDPTWLSRGMKHFIDDHSGRVSAVTGPYDYHDAEWFFRHGSLLVQRYIYRPVAYTLQLPFIKNGAVLIGGNNMIRVSVLKKTGGYNTALTFYGEDTDTAKRVADHGRVIFDPKLSMKTSARRFENEGFIKIEAKYLYYFFKTIFSPKKSSGN